MRESQIVKPIMDLLDILMAQGRCYYVRCINPGIITREDKPRTGQPDLVGWVVSKKGSPYEESLPFAWEVKGPRGTVSDEQAAELKCVAETGGQARVIRSFEEAVAALTELGIEVEAVGSATVAH